MTENPLEHVSAPKTEVLEKFPLAPLTTIGIGGPATRFSRCTSPDALARLLAEATRIDMPVFILGGGSNILVSDYGFSGMVIRMEIPGIDLENETTSAPLIVAGAGVEWDALVEFAVTRGLQGIECLSGIPGSVGASPIQNIGAYGQEAKETIEWVEVMDRESREITRIPGHECEFAYRHSRFKGRDKHRFVVIKVAYRLRRAAPGSLRYADLIRHFEETKIAQPTLAQIRAAVIAIRRRKSMVVDPTDPNSRSCGSFFMNPIVDEATFEKIQELAIRELLKAGEKMPSYPTGTTGQVKLSAAWLMERSGLQKGMRRGDAALSTNHILAITNQGNATSADVLELVQIVQHSVNAKFGITLEPEPVFVGNST